MGNYSIKDIEKLSGIKAHTIRIWEQRYQLITPLRTETNIRFYDDHQLRYMLNVSLLSKNGFKISKISQWSESEFHSKVQHLYEQTLIHDSSIQLDLSANDLMGAMIEMDAQKFHRIYEFSVMLHGFKKTITQLIYPYLEKVGILWSIGQINPAQEHFTSCLVRQKIIAAIDRLEEPSSGDKYLLVLPEGEHHEIGLLLAQYIIKESGNRVYYLGQDLPVANLEQAIKTIRPHMMVTFMVDPTIVGSAESLIKTILAVDPDTKLLVATRRTPELDQIQDERLQFLHSMEDLWHIIS